MFGRLLIRVDAGSQMGTGHWMRSLSLAQAWTGRGGSARFVTHLPPGDPLAQLADLPRMDLLHQTTKPASSDDLHATLEAIRNYMPAAIVLDGYHFDDHYRRSLAETRLPVLVLDDLADQDLRGAAIILNQNLYASEDDYQTIASSEARLLLGPQFALLRPEFSIRRPARLCVSESVSSILVTMGGADPANATRAVLDLIGRINLPPARLTVVVGSANPHAASIQEAARRLEHRHQMEVLCNPPDLIQRLSSADLVISAAGTTALELACLGKPSALVIAAGNQTRVAAAFHQMGAAVSLGDSAHLPSSGAAEKLHGLVSSASARAQVADRAHRWVDGRGASRVAEILATYPVRLRAAAEGDCGLLFAWANDPETRKMSFNSKAIPRPDHDAWFARRMTDPGTRLLIAVDPFGNPLGQVRFQKDNDGAVLSISVAPEHRGRGLAPKIARSGAFEVLDSRWTDRVLAWVIAGNEASTRTFQKAGFTPGQTRILQGRRANLFQLTTEGLHPALSDAIDQLSKP